MITRATLAALLAAVFLLACPVNGAGVEGDEGDLGVSNEMLYITIGLAVLVGGFLFLDVLAGSEEEIAPADTVSNPIVETGIEWDEVFPDDSITVAVSVFPGDNGSENAMQFIHVLNELTGNDISVYDEPLDLGTDSAVHRATIAYEFFSVDYLVFQVEDSETLMYAVASPDSILWTSTGQSDGSISSVVEELLQSAVFH